MFTSDEADVNPSASHLDLLAMARSVREAALDHDVERLHGDIARLRSALMAHVRSERDSVDALPAFGSDLASHGQRRLLDLLTAVLLEGDEQCNCLLRAVEVEVALRRQARLEERLRRGTGG